MKNKLSFDLSQFASNFIGHNLLIFSLFVFWWYTVLDGIVLHHYILDGKKIMMEIFLYAVGSFVFPLLYTFYILAYLSFHKIKEQSIYFKLIGFVWTPVLLFLLYFLYGLYGVDEKTYFNSDNS